MKYLMLLLVVSCVTSGGEVREANASSWEEAASCPSNMSNEQKASGSVRCRAMCASYGRGFELFDSECRCICAPERGKPGVAASHLM